MSPTQVSRVPVLEPMDRIAQELVLTLGTSFYQ